MRRRIEAFNFTYGKLKYNKLYEDPLYPGVFSNVAEASHPLLLPVITYTLVYDRDRFLEERWVWNGWDSTIYAIEIEAETGHELRSSFPNPLASVFHELADHMGFRRPPGIQKARELLYFIAQHTRGCSP